MTTSAERTVEVPVRKDENRSCLRNGDFDETFQHHCFPKNAISLLLCIAFSSVFVMGYLSAEYFGGGPVTPSFRRKQISMAKTEMNDPLKQTVEKSDLLATIADVVESKREGGVDTDTQDGFPVVDEEIPHVVFGDLRYRRVCAPVHSSVLCMTVRHPFTVPLQNPNVTYADPINKEVYELERGAFRFIDGEELDACRNRADLISDIDEAVKDCLDRAAELKGKFRNIVVAVWTRRKFGYTELFGTNGKNQPQHIDEYFNKDLIMVLGASRSPGVTAKMVPLFGECKPAGVSRSSAFCTGHKSRRKLKFQPYTNIPDDVTFIGMEGYHAADYDHGLAHGLPEHNLTTALPLMGLARKPGWTELRNLTIIIEYPIAHSQNQLMVLNEWDKVVEIQKGLPDMMMSVATESGRKVLARRGFRLHNMIVFDGLPQTFPTVTGSHLKTLLKHGREKDLLAQGMYPGWFPELGSKCRGPLPPHSKQKAVNLISRQSFEDNGLDMNWYGRSWEFANLFWWQTRGWNAKRIDCSHSDQYGDGYYGVHKFFIQVMVDDYFE